MRSTRINIYLDNIRSNFRNIKQMAKGKMVCAAVKADAYGHGAVKVSKVLEEEGCDYLAVATAPEALELFEAEIKLPILLLTLQTPEELYELIHENIELVVASKDYIDRISELAAKKHITIKLHLKIDTGMGRIGCMPEETLELTKYIKEKENVVLQGVATHFSTADTQDTDYRDLQVKIFKDQVEILEAAGLKPDIIHSCNSGGIIKLNENYTNMVRAGIILYGFPPSNLCKTTYPMKPALELESYIVSLKKLKKGSSISYKRTYKVEKEEEYIAVLTLGYADGYSRILSNLGYVAVNGKKFPIVGKVCMDQIMIKVDETVNLYDRVVLIGFNNGEPTADEIAEKIGTISYEVLTNLHRVKKHYIN